MTGQIGISTVIIHIGAKVRGCALLSNSVRQQASEISTSVEKLDNETLRANQDLSAAFRPIGL